MALSLYPVKPVPRRVPRLRVYDGFYAVGKTGRVSFTRQTRNGSIETPYIAATGTGTSLVLGTPYFGPKLSSVPVNATILVGLITETAVTVTAPAGYTQDVTAASSGVTIRVYRKLSAGTEGDTATFSFNSSTTATAILVAYTGITTSSPLDKTATNTGTTTGFSLTLTTGTTAATVQANEIAIAFWSGNMAGGGSAPTAVTAGYAVQGTAGTGWPTQITVADHVLTATGAQSASAVLQQGVSAAITGLSAILTYKIDSAANRFAPLGEADSWDGQATWKGADVSTFQATVPADDPVAPYLVPNAIVEVFLPRYVCEDLTVLPAETFGWYYVVHIAEEHSGSVKRITVSGPDLRQKIADRVANYTVLSSARGPSSFTATDWIRRLIDYTCITITGTPDVTIAIPGLALESVAGTTGTVYSDPPFSAGAQLGQAIAALAKKDSIQWRIVVINPGQSTAALQVQTYYGVSRTIGSSGESVFARQWDTASAVRRVRDGSNAVTALTVRTPPSGAIQVSVTVSDASAIEQWGYIHGYADSTNQPYPTTASALALLYERLPKDFAEVEMSDATWCQAFRHYRPGDVVTVLDGDGHRFDGPITAFTIYSTGSLQSAEQDLSLWMPRPVTAGPVPITNPYGTRGVIGPSPAGSGGPAGTLTVGYDPSSQWQDAREGDGGANRQYTHLPGLTKSATDINSVANGATANPRQGGGITASSGGTPSVTAVSNPGTIGSQTINSASGDITDAAKVADVQAAINNIITQLNNLSNHFPNAAAQSSTSTAVSTVNTSAQNVLSAHNSTVSQLQAANIVL